MVKSHKLLITCMSEAWGGLEMAASELAMEFHKNNFDVLFGCYKDSPIVQVLKDNGIAYESIEGQASHLRKVVWFRKTIGEFNPETVLINRLPTLKALVPALVGKGRINLVALSHMLVNYKKKDPFHRVLYSRLNRLIVLTEHQKRNHLDFLPIPPAKIEIIPDWINCKTQEPLERQDIKSLYQEKLRHLPISLIASRLDPQKGQDLAIRALGRAAKQGRPFLLAVLGENTRGQRDIRTELLQLAEAEGVSNYVRFFGYHENIFPFILAADNVLVPSKEETFGRVIIEAMSHGTPVIASNRGGPTCIIDHMRSGMLFESENVDDLESKIFEINSNQTLRSRIAKNAKTESKKYDKDLVFRKLTQVIVPADTTVSSPQLNYLDR